MEVYLDNLGLAYETSKPLLEFKAFYEAFNMKFKNLKFPEFPEGAKFKQPQQKMDKFRELFDQVLLYAQQYQAEMSVQLMKMLYMFLLQKAKPLAKK